MENSKISSRIKGCGVENFVEVVGNFSMKLSKMKENLNRAAPVRKGSSALWAKGDGGGGKKGFGGYGTDRQGYGHL